MGSVDLGLAANIVIAIFTVVLAVATAFLAYWNFRSAQAAKNLYDIQLSSLGVQESAARANLELYDVHQKHKPGQPPDELKRRVLIVQLVNLGMRAARMRSATLQFSIGEREPQRIPALDSAVVRSQEIVEFEIGATVLKGLTSAIEAAEVASRTAGSTSSVIPPARLRVEYSDVGTPLLFVGEFDVNLLIYRPETVLPDTYYRIVRSDDERQ